MNSVIFTDEGLSKGSLAQKDNKTQIRSLTDRGTALSSGNSMRMVAETGIIDLGGPVPPGSVSVAIPDRTHQQ